VLAEGPPPDVYVGLVLLVLAMVAGVVMTAIVIVRNRRDR
jgi:subtilase family serine protease